MSSEVGWIRNPITSYKKTKKLFMERMNIQELKNLPFMKEEMLAFVAWQEGSFTPGRYEFGHGIYANAEKYTTKDRVKDNRHFERHEKMYDVQILVKGMEQILFAPVDERLTEVEAYDPKRDIAFLDGEATEALALKTKTFCVIGPDMAHMPCLNLDGKQREVRKIVFKIPVGIYEKAMGK